MFIQSLMQQQWFYIHPITLILRLYNYSVCISIQTTSALISKQFIQLWFILHMSLTWVERSNIILRSTVVINVVGARHVEWVPNIVIRLCTNMLYVCFCSFCWDIIYQQALSVLSVTLPWNNYAARFIHWPHSPSGQCTLSQSTHIMCTLWWSCITIGPIAVHFNTAFYLSLITRSCQCLVSLKYRHL